MGKFTLGQLVATRRIYNATRSDPDFARFVNDSLRRYLACDWGDLFDEDKATNDESVAQGDGRIMGAYVSPDQKYGKIWIITEWDRSCTTILFPDEY